MLACTGIERFTLAGKSVESFAKYENGNFVSRERIGETLISHRNQNVVIFSIRIRSLRLSMYNVGLENEEVVQALKVSAGNKARKAAMLAGAYHFSFFFPPETSLVARSKHEDYALFAEKARLNANHIAKLRKEIEEEAEAKLRFEQEAEAERQKQNLSFLQLCQSTFFSFIQFQA